MKRRVLWLPAFIWLRIMPLPTKLNWYQRVWLKGWDIFDLWLAAYAADRRLIEATTEAIQQENAYLDRQFVKAMLVCAVKRDMPHGIRGE